MSILNDILLNVIDKKTALANIDQEEAFSKLLGDQKITSTGKALNVLRKESDASIRFMWTADNRLYAKDWADESYKGDLISWIKFYERDVNNKIITNQQAINKIVNGLDTLDLSKRLEDNFTYTHKEKNSSKIEIEAYLDKDGYAIFNEIDLNYWSNFGITKKNIDILYKFGIFSCKNVWVQNNKFTEYYYNSNGPIYAYYFDEGKYKIYNPFGRKEQKWRCNHELVDDIGFEKNNKFTILTKSRKDRVVWKVLGYDAYCYSNEYVPNELAYKTDLIFYDNDYTKPLIKNTGIKKGKQISDKFGVPYRYIDSKYECTDLAEVSEKYGISFARKLANSIIKSLKN